MALTTRSLDKASLRYHANMAAAEALRAIEKYPKNDQLFLSLLQEAGELATALRSGSSAHITAEAHQVAALALRIILRGDNDAATAFAPLEALGDLDMRLEDAKRLLKISIGRP